MSESSHLFRSFTHRRAKKSGDNAPGMPSRSFSTKKSSGSGNRVQISAPMTLLSTTNMLSYNAPDIGKITPNVPPAMQHRYPSSESTTPGSTRSAEESDRSSTGSRGVSTDASSLDSVPTSPEGNHLTGFFDAAQKAQKERVQLHMSSSSSGSHRTQSSTSSRMNHSSKSSFDTHRSSESSTSPAIPQRARSHSKEAHELMARKRSIRNMGPPSTLHSRSPSTNEQRASVDMFRSHVDSAHPFGKELEQLNEVVEELGGVIRDVVLDEDTRHMQEKGLVKFCVSDYLAEIDSDEENEYEKHQFASAAPPAGMTWI
ncbi:uncharacterized protein K452DRAFT_304546 [Aplosporella prunicola CBS 121167]|uniref:Uncharacterized protein n=1 Tax=Aplosporella prunicola CBS 121167 TaxID=1176127 RepID=A0A6A6BUW3_9PEZI|nr:uncharacterized protein K452DRAFT_304546 [Aplosporella prunicola CBS 121167]KAF2146597.1 hypothetical protein K452DRAFT_304546 [Aplosporella prunicola CBS 121167]